MGRTGHPTKGKTMLTETKTTTQMPTTATMNRALGYLASQCAHCKFTITVDSFKRTSGTRISTMAALVRRGLAECGGTIEQNWKSFGITGKGKELLASI